MCNFLCRQASERLQDLSCEFTLSKHTSTADRLTVKETMNSRPSTIAHEHVAKRVHVLLQKAGIPYEMEQQVCQACARILDEKTVKRAAA
jgi:NMD protein affecting ribosome stability and mRNA decay